MIMKTKYLIIYFAVGVAFLAVSIWAFLSNGSSAKAIRYKYKLGGIMLTAWAMLTFASCEGPGPLVTCYDPVPPEYCNFQGKDTVKNGDVLVVTIITQHSGLFRCQVFTYPGGEGARELQVQDFECQAGETECKITIAAGDYKGEAVVAVYNVEVADDGTENMYEIGSYLITII